MNHVFGPVPSWRLGQSLGVDPVPLKTCNWNCVYCQLGRTKPVTMRRARYVPENAAVDEVRQALATDEAERIDWVTFVGSGETLLHSKIGWMLRAVKDLTDIPVAVITNGSLLFNPHVRYELAVADAVLPSLDAGNEDLYRRINRPHRAVTFERHVEGLIAFRKEYSGRLWVEIMLLRGMNDGDRELAETASVLGQIRPDEIHINGPSRSPVEPWVECPDAEAVIRATDYFESVAPVRVVHAAEGAFKLATGEPVLDATLQLITRHPMSRAALERTLEQHAPGSAREVMKQLEQSGRAQAVVRGGTEYWVAAQTNFPSRHGGPAATRDRNRRP